jgi:hypothetical protein
LIIFNKTSAMNNPSEDQNLPGIMDDYSDTQKEILAIETRRTRNKLFIIAAVIFAADLIALLTADAVNLSTLLIVAVIPVVIVGLAFLSLKEPLLAMILIVVILVAVWVYTFTQLGPRSLIQGWLIKAIVIALIIAGFQNAMEAHRVRKEMR